MKSKIILFSVIVFTFLLVSCEYNSDSIGSNSDSDSGQGGSMARFTIVGDNLFTVDKTNLKVFDLNEPLFPVYRADVNVGIEVETIFPLGDKLFLGTGMGMYIYDVTLPNTPKKLAYYQHVVACDPVVSDGSFAYVTLNSVSERCWRAVNELQVLSLDDISNPQLIAKYPMENPRGMALRNDTLWVCDSGLRVFDVKDKLNIIELAHFEDLQAFDLILDKNRALVIGESGFAQYKIESDTIRKLSEIHIEL